MGRKSVRGAVVICIMLTTAATAGGRMLPTPHNYGKVIIRTVSGKPTMDAVRFDHWLHRSMFTCRLCHVDIGFAMEANGTEITAQDNIEGHYCGSCHNGRRVINDKVVFSACTTSAAPADAPRCDRCHSAGRKVQKEYDYDAFSQKYPKQRLGQLIDWEKAEESGILHLIDTLPGISFSRPRLDPQKDFEIKSGHGSWMPNIIFSHKKHAVWNGCEVCHPDIFPSVKKGTVKYTMFEISEGRYCGLCHTKVAFPLNDCEKCHIDKVQ